MTIQHWVRVRQASDQPPTFFLASGALLSSRQLWPGQTTAAWDLSVLGDARWTSAGDYRLPALECRAEGRWCRIGGCGYGLGWWIGEGMSLAGARTVAAAFGAVLIHFPEVERALPQPRWWCPVHGELDFDDDAGAYADGTPYCLMPNPKHPDVDCGFVVTRGVEGFAEVVAEVFWRGVSLRQLRPARPGWRLLQVSGLDVDAALAERLGLRVGLDFGAGTCETRWFAAVRRAMYGGERGGQFVPRDDVEGAS